MNLEGTNGSGFKAIALIFHIYSNILLEKQDVQGKSAGHICGTSLSPIIGRSKHLLVMSDKEFNFCFQNFNFNSRIQFNFRTNSNYFDRLVKT